jgi:endonuclease-3
MPEFNRIVARLKQHYGKPGLPPAKGPFELVMWENACYLLPDERRLEVFEAMREKVSLNAEAISGASDEVLLPLARRGGMRPETRVSRWREIANITLNQYGGDLSTILKMPYVHAKKALKQFPAVGDPGAEKILLLCGVSSGLPLESNGLRVMVRLGWGRLQRDYASTYRSVQASIQPELPTGTKGLQEAHLLLRTHGMQLCRDKTPLCHQCPLSIECNYAQGATTCWKHGSL